MLDRELFRKSPEVIRKDLEHRKADTKIVDKVIKLDEAWRKALRKAENLKHTRNQVTREIAELKKAGKSAKKKISEMKKVSDDIAKQDKDIQKKKASRDAVLMRVPNLLHKSVPRGDNNKDVRKWGKPKKKDIPPHGEILEKLGFADFRSATKISGAGFYFLRGELVLLDYALQRFALDNLVEKGFTPIAPPLMMNRGPYEGVTDLEDFENVMYKIEGEDQYLIATSEHPIAAMFMGEVVPEEVLPLKLVGVSQNFRKEIGSHGVDTRGLFRVHQFNKVEQFIFCRPEKSWEWQERLIGNAEDIFQQLELPYRVVNICTGDIGTVAAKKYDLEVWSPRQNAYTEAVSCSNCTDYQSRRLNIKYGKRGGNTQLVHTINSTAIATSRALVALVENNYEDGVIKLPKAIRPYMNGRKEIG
ncbi:serine--tRNA ligase [archaeon]